METHASILVPNARIHTSDHAENTSFQRSVLQVKIVAGSTSLNGMRKKGSKL
mgnify:CR=1 FL=1